MSALGMSNSKQVPRLVWVIEPENKFRFRYESETGSHGGLLGKKGPEPINYVEEKKKKGKKEEKRFPTVRLENYHAYKGVFVKVTLLTSDHEEHVLELKGKHVKKNNVCYENLTEDFTATFTNLIIRNKKKECAQKILMDKELKKHPRMSASELEFKVKETVKKITNSVTLCFQAFSNNKAISNCLYSEPITNQKASIRIHRMSRCSGSSKGNDEIILLCDKIKKEKVKVVFYEMSENGDIVWRDEGKFEPKADVHHQVAITFKTPPYKENVEKDVKVCLLQEDEESESIDFKYTTVDDDINVPLKKRKRCAESSSTSTSFEYNSEPSPSSSSYGGSSDNAWNSESLSAPEANNVVSNDMQLGDIQGESQENREDFNQFLNDDNFMDIEEHFRPDFWQDILSLGERDGDELDVEGQSYQRDCVQNQSLSDNGDVNSVEDKIFKIENKELSERQEYHRDRGIDEPDLATVSVKDKKEKLSVKHIEACMKLFSKKDKAGNTYLHCCVLHNRNALPVLKVLKLCNINILNEQNKKRQAALHIATQKDDCEVVKLLCSYGADLGIKDVLGNNCIHIAAKYNSVNSMRILLENAQPKQINNFNYDGFTPLHLSIINAATSCFQALLKVADLNAKDKTRGRTPLHHAVESESLVFVTDLVHMPGVDVNAQDFSGDSPLHLASAMGNLNIINQLLIAGANATLMNFRKIYQQSEEDSSVDATIDGQTPLEVSANSIVTDLLLNSMNRIQNNIVDGENLVSYFDDALSLKHSENDEKVCRLLDKELKANDWRELTSIYVGMEDFAVNALVSSTSPALTLINYLKKVYGDDYKAALKSYFEMAVLNQPLKIVQDNYC